MSGSSAAMLMARRDPFKTLCGKERQFVYGTVGEDGFQPVPPPLSKDPYDTEAIMKELADAC
jgi:hypothetical protein